MEFSTKNPSVSRRIVYAFQIALVALVVVLAVPAHAAGDREVKSRVAPVYPELAKRMKITGAVKVTVSIDATGKVIEAKTVSGNRMLAPAAEDAVKRWKFEAGVQSTEEVDINFSLAN